MDKIGGNSLKTSDAHYVFRRTPFYKTKYEQRQGCPRSNPDMDVVPLEIYTFGTVPPLISCR